MTAGAFVTLSFFTFRSRLDPNHFIDLCQILERHGEAFVPEVIERNQRTRHRSRVRYRIGDPQILRSRWVIPGVMLRSPKPYRTLSFVKLAQDREHRTGMPTHFIMFGDVQFFDAHLSLSKLVSLGNALYEFFSPFYGFIELPWLQSGGWQGQPLRGYPGLAWANWLGPEYAELFPLVQNSGVIVQHFGDGGRLVCLPNPRDVVSADDDLLRLRDSLQGGWPTEALQQPVKTPPAGLDLQGLGEWFAQSLAPGPRLGDNRILPRFRFIDEAGGWLEESHEPTPRYGPEGFTRVSSVREILDPLESDQVYAFEYNAGAVYFVGLTPAAARRLMEILPPEQRQDCLEASPTFEDFVRLGERYPMIRLFGYRIVPEQDDERVTIQGLMVSKDELPRSLIAELRRQYPTPEFARWDTREGKKVLVVKWD